MPQSFDHTLDPLQIALGRALAMNIVPEEEPFFVDIVSATQKAPRSRKDHTLGFGVSVGDIGVASGVLFAMSKPILEFIWDNAKDAAGDLIKDEASTVRQSLEGKLRTWFGNNLRGKSPVTLPSDKIDVLISDVNKDAINLGLDKSVSEKLSTVLRNALS